MSVANKELYDVYSITLVNWLVRRNHRIIRVADSTKEQHPNQKVFQFRFNQRLKQDVEDFKVVRNSAFKVYSLEEANWLIFQGHDLLRAEDSDQDISGKMKMFLFNDSEKLQIDRKNFVSKKSN